MPHKDPVSSTDRLGQVIAVMADMSCDRDALEEKGGPKCGRHVVRIIATAEMLLEAKYRYNPEMMMRQVLFRVAEATIAGKDPLIEIERWMNQELGNSIAPIIMH
tara:strand:- start:299 stop:613 length:315 start_codon:yes stop_codon:yes gene_type:complete